MSPENSGTTVVLALIAHTEGKASHELLQTAIEALTCMTHRGGINADGKTGDGCGLLLKKPDSFFRKVAAGQGITLPDTYGVGMLFLHPEADKAAAQRAIVEEELKRQQVEVYGWRDVPTDPEYLGPIARESLPGVCTGAGGCRRVVGCRAQPASVLRPSPRGKPRRHGRLFLCLLTVLHRRVL